jgi:hypothetical protein
LDEEKPLHRRTLLVHEQRSTRFAISSEIEEARGLKEGAVVFDRFFAASRDEHPLGKLAR